MVYQMNLYRLVPPKEGQPGYERPMAYVAANSFGEALAISDAQYPGYEVTGIVQVGRVSLDIHKLPETGASINPLDHEGMK
jgi:hypothetical protein